MPPKITLSPGDVFGRLTVLAEVRHEGYKHVCWRCRCVCGAKVIVRGASLRSGMTRSCGCIARTPVEVGARFGKLVVLGEGGRSKDGKPLWSCRCDCGEGIEYRPITLKRGAATSCGCGRIRHGMARSSEYRVWISMIQRCTNPGAGDFKNYGGRGIQVHSSWRGRGGFQQFMVDIGTRPTSQHTIDRINNEGNYEPRNVRWATRSENQRNRRPAPRRRLQPGDQFGLWTVVAESDPITIKEGRYRYRCRCRCGRQHDVAVSTLIRGLSKSCGACGSRRKH